MIDDRGDTPDGPGATPSEVEADLGVFEKRVAPRVELLIHGAQQGRHPERIRLVETPGQPEKELAFPAISYLMDLNVCP